MYVRLLLLLCTANAGLCLSRAEWGTWVDIKQDASIVFQKSFKEPKPKVRSPSSCHQAPTPISPLSIRKEYPIFIGDHGKRSPGFFIRPNSQSACPPGYRYALASWTEGSRKHDGGNRSGRYPEVFSPYAPPIPARLKTLELLADAGIPTQATIAPMLPSSDRFAAILRPLVNRVCIDDYFMGDGSGGRRTRSLGIEALYKELGLEEWYHPAAYRKVYEQLKLFFPEDQLYISQRGFEPSSR